MSSAPIKSYSNIPTDATQWEKDIELGDITKTPPQDVDSDLSSNQSSSENEAIYLDESLGDSEDSGDSISEEQDQEQMQPQKRKNFVEDLDEQFGDDDNILKKGNKKKAVIKRNFGNCWVFCFKDGEPMFTIGPHCNFLFAGPFFICLCSTFAMVGYMITKNTLKDESWEVRLLTTLVTTIQCFLYGGTFLKNPGIISTTNEEPTDLDYQKSQRWCEECRCYMTEDVEHCDDCEVCVAGYDHLCPWTGKCIGKGNLSFFYAFLASTLCFVCYCFVVVTIYTADDEA